VVAVAKRGAHVVVTPSQTSSRSQAVPPVAAKHTVPAGRITDAGHAADEPVHVEAVAHAPAGPPHAVPAVTNVSAGHALEVPLQTSATSHAPADARHVVSTAANRQLDVQHPPPSHCSGPFTMPSPQRPPAEQPATGLHPKLPPLPDGRHS
jgi:hypothetical protein